jgi:hypothetical protein
MSAASAESRTRAASAASRPEMVPTTNSESQASPRWYVAMLGAIFDDGGVFSRGCGHRGVVEAGRRVDFGCREKCA